MKHLPKDPAHTPGPWHGFAYEVRDEKNNFPICTLTGKASGYRDMTEDTANQCLISAAPDLLAFAVDFLDYIDDPNMEIEELKRRAQATILKAQGGKQ